MIDKRSSIFLSLFIATLNIFDGIATHFGLLFNKIEEFNPIMNILWASSPILFLAVKITLSFFIYLLTYLVCLKSSEQFQMLFNYCLKGLFVIYLAIFGLHMYWITLI